MTAEVSEYDRFGPWIDEVRRADDVPRLFRDHPLDLDAARLVLKVPRNIARRDATPDMDLYDHLLAVDDEILTVLSRRTAPAGGSRRQAAPERPRGFDVLVVPLAEVVAVRDVVRLLDGRLAVHLRDGGVVVLPFNGSGRAKVAALIDVLRSSAAGHRPTPVGDALLAAATARPSGPLDVGRDDVALLSDTRDVVRDNPQVVPWTGHGRRVVLPGVVGVVGVVRRALHAASPMTLHGCVLAGDDVALEVLGRHDWLVRGRTPAHSSSRLVVPWRSIDAIGLAPHDLYPAATVATIRAGAASVPVVVPTGSAAHELLAAAAS